MRQVVRTSVVAALLLAGAAAHAQYAWIDAQGVRHYADQPPPPGTPAANILKMPRPASGALASAPTPLAEREADYQKRRAATDASEQKAAREEKMAEAKRANCAAAARNKAQLETGRRVRGPDNVVMSEADKAREQAQIAAILKDCN